MISAINERIPLFKTLRHRSFALLWFGQLISLLGDGVFRVALAWYVLILTHSAFTMGAVYAASLVPTILVTLFGGVAADRLPRRLILLWSDTGRGIVVLLIAVLAVMHVLALWHLLLLSILFGIADGFFKPAFHAITPQLVESEQLVPANAVLQGIDSLSRLAGPLLGAALVAFTGGQALAFGLDAFSFFVSAACLLMLRMPKASPATHQEEQEVSLDQAEGGSSIFADVRAGFGYVVSQQWLWVTIAIVALSNLTFSAPFVAVLPKLVQSVFHAGPGLFGALLAADAIGFLAATIALAMVKVRRRGVVAYSATMISCLGLVVLGLPLPHGSLPVIATVACLGTGFGIGMFSVIEMSLLQEYVPNDLQGRVVSVDMLGSFILLPLGVLAVGWLGDLIGPAPVFIVGGLISLALAAMGLCLPSIRQLN
jgi:MFS family permease